MKTFHINFSCKLYKELPNLMTSAKDHTSHQSLNFSLDDDEHHLIKYIIQLLYVNEVNKSFNDILIKSIKSLLSLRILIKLK